jgi:hypothetical protein
LKKNNARMSAVNKSHERFLFKGASNPSNVERKKYHGHDLDRDLMPLSTPRSVESADGTIEGVAVEQAFLRALRVFIGDVSRAMP